MTVVSVAYPLLPVHAGSAGGAEQILFLLDREFVLRGHRSVVIAAKGSQVSGELVETDVVEGEITDEARSVAQRTHRKAIENAIRNFRPDAVHLHGLDFPEYLPATPTARLATLHLPLDWYAPAAFADPRLRQNGVSQTQVNARPDLALAMVPNGIDLTRYRVASDTPRKFLLWMGRVCPEKGVHIALEAAHRLRRPLLLAGAVHPFSAHHEYFETRVKPMLDSDRRFVGPVDGPAKAEMLRNAAAVLVPSLAAETSSLVAMEAAASGTPVIAYRAGALPEVVEHGRSGFIVDSLDEMVEAVRNVASISPERCRTIAEERFDARRMAADYLKLYEAICGAGVPTAPGRFA